MSSVYCQRIYTLDLNFGFLLAAPLVKPEVLRRWSLRSNTLATAPFYPLASINRQIYFRYQSNYTSYLFDYSVLHVHPVVVVVERIQCSFKKSIQVVNNDRPQESLIKPDRRGSRSNVVKMELALPVPVVGSGSALPPLGSIKEVLVTVSTYP